MSCRDTARELVRHREIDPACVGEAIERLRLVEAPHVDRPLDRLTLAGKRVGTVGTARHRDDAAVKLRREGPVGLDLGEAGGLTLLERREVEEGKADGALDLEGALAGQEHDPGVGVDAVHGDAAISRRTSKKRKHVVLRVVLRSGSVRHAAVRRGRTVRFVRACFSTGSTDFTTQV